MNKSKWLFKRNCYYLAGVNNWRTRILDAIAHGSVVGLLRRVIDYQRQVAVRRSSHVSELGYNWIMRL